MHRPVWADFWMKYMLESGTNAYSTNIPSQRLMFFSAKYLYPSDNRGCQCSRYELILYIDNYHSTVRIICTLNSQSSMETWTGNPWENLTKTDHLTAYSELSQSRCWYKNLSREVPDEHAISGHPLYPWESLISIDDGISRAFRVRWLHMESCQSNQVSWDLSWCTQQNMLRSDDLIHWKLSTSGYV